MNGLSMESNSSRPALDSCAFVAEPDYPPADHLGSVPDVLREPVTDAVLPPSVRSPELLPFGARTATDFERICLVIAEKVDGLHDVRVYGVPGQAQQGLDLIGWGDRRLSVAYQAKRYEDFTASDLEAAVEKFAKGRRPFRPSRFVVCVSCVVDRTEVLETLERLRTENDFEIDLYDGRRLSGLLVNRDDLVRRLFGDEWARLFVGGEVPTPPQRTSADVLADALLRGPIVV